MALFGSYSSLDIHDAPWMEYRSFLSVIPVQNFFLVPSATGNQISLSAKYNSIPQNYFFVVVPTLMLISPLKPENPD